MTRNSNPDSFMKVALFAALVACGMALYLFWQNQQLSYQLAVSRQVIPSPTPTSTMQGITYLKNYSNEFTIKVPANWTKDSDEFPTQYLNYDPSSGVNPPNFVYPRDKGKLKIEISGVTNATLEEIILQEKTPSMNPDETFIEKDIILDKQKAKIIESESSGTSVAIVQNPTNNHIYIIRFYLDFNNYTSLRDQILSTFKFNN